MLGRLSFEDGLACVVHILHALTGEENTVVETRGRKSKSELGSISRAGGDELRLWIVKGSLLLGVGLTVVFTVYALLTSDQLMLGKIWEKSDYLVTVVVLWALGVTGRRNGAGAGPS